MLAHLSENQPVGYYCFTAIQSSTLDPLEAPPFDLDTLPYGGGGQDGLLQGSQPLRARRRLYPALALNQTVYAELDSMVYDSLRGYIHAGSEQNRTYKLRVSDFTLVASVDLIDKKMAAAVIDAPNGYVYYGKDH